MHIALLVVGSSALAANAQLSPFQEAQAECLDKCHVADQNCRTQCIQVHNPADDPILEVQQCQARCKQGDGSAEETSRYGICLSDCVAHANDVVTILPNVVATTTAVATLGSTSGLVSSSSTAASSSVTAVVKPSVTTIGTATSTGQNSKASATNAADVLQSGVSGLGLAGLLGAFFM